MRFFNWPYDKPVSTDINIPGSARLENNPYPYIPKHLLKDFVHMRYAYSSGPYTVLEDSDDLGLSLNNTQEFIVIHAFNHWIRTGTININVLPVFTDGKDICDEPANPMVIILGLIQLAQSHQLHGLVHKLISYADKHEAKCSNFKDLFLLSHDGQLCLNSLSMPKRSNDAVNQFMLLGAMRLGTFLFDESGDYKFKAINETNDMGTVSMGHIINSLSRIENPKILPKFKGKRLHRALLDHSNMKPRTSFKVKTHKASVLVMNNQVVTLSLSDPPYWYLASTPSNIDQFRKLPLELLVMIFGYGLTFDHPLRPAPPSLCRRGDTNVNVDQLLISKKIGEAATQAFRKNNHFLLGTVIGPEISWFMNSGYGTVTLNVAPDYPFDKGLIQRLQGVRVLTINLYKGIHLYVGLATRHLVDDLIPAEKETWFFQIMQSNIVKSGDDPNAQKNLEHGMTVRYVHPLGHWKQKLLLSNDMAEVIQFCGWKSVVLNIPNGLGFVFPKSIRGDMTKFLEGCMVDNPPVAPFIPDERFNTCFSMDFDKLAILPLIKEDEVTDSEVEN